MKAISIPHLLKRYSRTRKWTHSGEASQFYYEVGKLAFINQNVDKIVYRNILKENGKICAEKLCLGNDYYFQHGNDPEHSLGRPNVGLIILFIP